MTEAPLGSACVTDGLVPPICDLARTGDGQNLFFGEWPGPGPAVVCMHGLTNQHRSFAGVAAALCGRLGVVSIDLRGRGLSSKPDAGSYGIEQHARDVIDVMDALGLDDVVATGHSMGAAVATAVAVMDPGRVRGLVLIDGGAAVASGSPPDIDPDALFETMLSQVVKRLRTTYPTPEAYLDWLRDLPYFEGLDPVGEADYLYDLGRTAEGYVPRCSEHAAREDWRDLLTDPATRGRLREVRCPVLMVGAEWGLTSNDPPIVGPEQVALAREFVSDLGFVLVERTSHHTVIMSIPGSRATAEAILGFVQKLEPESVREREVSR